jgi:hypothetical protein
VCKENELCTRPTDLRLTDCNHESLSLLTFLAVLVLLRNILAARNTSVTSVASRENWFSRRLYFAAAGQIWQHAFRFKVGSTVISIVYYLSFDEHFQDCWWACTHPTSSFNMH